MENSPQPRGRFARFSIRELLLATVAIAAVVAVFVQRRPFDQHAMLQSFDPRAVIQKTCGDLGLVADVPASSHSSGVVFDGGYHVEAESDLAKPSYTDIKTKLMPELRKRIEQQIEDDGGEIVGHSTGGSEDQSELARFSFEYRRGRVRGITRAYVFEDPSGTSKLLVLLDEY